ncbi:MAG: right-handed parallel beta-helix repeat-containing protein [Sorangiineae bacterium]|nr:right-handed parallel beta-helix repeat-containing protein [Sorangiineae bacterium]
MGITVEIPDEASAGAALEYRLDDGGWTPGPPLVHTEGPGTTRWAWRASLFPLRQGTRAGVRVTLKGDAQVVLEATTTVKTLNVAPTGRTFHVAPNGDDQATGGSADKAWRTLRHAVSTAACGDTVLVAPGVYAERLSFKGKHCTAAEPFVLRRGQPQRPIVDNGIKVASGWALHRDDIWVQDVPVPEDKVVRILTVDGRRAMRYLALADLEQDAGELQLGRSYFQERLDAVTRRVYLKTGLGDAPDTHEVLFSQSGTSDTRAWADNIGLAFTDASHVVVDGFEVRHAGGRGAVFWADAHDNLITNCLFHANNVDIELRQGSGNLVWGNEVHELGTGDYPWGAFYDARTENYESFVPVMLKGDRGLSLVDNELHDGWDLVSASFAFEARGRADSDIFFNRLYNSADDALELDGPGINLRVYGNQFRHVFAGVSLAPITVGPTYVARNTFTFDAYVLKQNNCLGADQDGHVFAWNNSAYPLRRCSVAAVSMAPWDCGAEPYDFENRDFRNNAFIVNDPALRGRPGIVLDFNAWGTLASVERPFIWSARPGETQRYSLSELRVATGLEAHGLSLGAEGAGFVNTAGLRASECLQTDYRVTDYPAALSPFSGEDFALLPTSPLVDRGTPVGDFFAGTAPDIGALERGQPPPWHPDSPFWLGTTTDAGVNDGGP